MHDTTNKIVNSESADNEIAALAHDIEQYARLRGWSPSTTGLKIFGNSRLVASLSRQSSRIAGYRARFEKYRAKHPVHEDVSPDVPEGRDR